MANAKFSVVDVGDYLSKRQTAQPTLSEDWARLEELYNKKLWHQLTLKLQDMVQRPELQSGDQLLQLYNNCISVLDNKINPLSLIEMCSYMLPQFSNKKEAISFLEKMETKVKANDEALTLCQVFQGQIYLEHLQDMTATKNIIEDLADSLEDADGVTPVHGRYYKLASDYYRQAGPLSQYYRTTLRYIGCEDGGARLPLEERREVAFRLALAGLLADDVYNLSELLAHPIMSWLEGTPQAWAGECVRAAAHGDLAAWEALRPRWGAVSDLARADIKLRQKIAILCLCEMAFKRPSSQRRLTFDEIASEARVPDDEVELLVMKCLAKKLIRGAIDQVQRVVRVTWVRPRALSAAQVAALACELDVWCEAVNTAARLLHDSAHDVLTL